MTFYQNHHLPLRMSPGRVSGQRLVAALALANALAWSWAFVLYAHHPAIVGTAVLAWLLGLRHAFDTDHIAAIDNVVRKLMHDGESPRTAGLYFALGHSTVVVVVTIVLASVASAGLAESGGWLSWLGGWVGSSVSASFLLLIASANLVVLLGLWRQWRAARRSGRRIHAADSQPSMDGMLIRLLRPLLRMVSRSWHMYPLGFVFGLGFDTATEIGLLSMSAAEAARGSSLLHVLVFPALFAAAMVTVDTADSVLMTAAYDWAQAQPERRLRYNMAITAASVVIAFVIGGVETCGLLAPLLGAVGGWWETLNAQLANLGIVITVVFAVAWAGAVLFSRRQAVARATVRHDGGSADDAAAETGGTPGVVR